MSDDYFIDEQHRDAGGGGAAQQAGATGSGGADAQGGTTASARAGQAGAPECVRQTERCNGRDDDCDGRTDEAACPAGCTAFELEGHGYMLCGDSHRANAAMAQSACKTQELRLVWIETATENAKLQELIFQGPTPQEVTLGLTDAEAEATWRWMDGEIVWQGAVSGSAVGGAYTNWYLEDPNGNRTTNCAVMVADGTWRDRECTEAYPYLCEEP